MEYGLIPLLFATGVLSVRVAAALVMIGGSAARTAYTAARCLQNAARGQRAPWVALTVGVLPVVGNVAFPAQLLADGSDPTRGLARLLVVDLFAKAGRMIPIWGGPDTRTEHALARVGHQLAARITRRRATRDQPT